MSRSPLLALAGNVRVLPPQGPEDIAVAFIFFAILALILALSVEAGVWL